MALAVDTDISQRHLSFIESGRSQPSREMLLRLSEQLSVPVRERNALLMAAGFAPLYRERPLKAPELAAANNAVARILQGHLPHPALAVDRHWNLLLANRAAQLLMAGVVAALPPGPVNVLRLTLHPDGLSNRILNLPEWREHLLLRLAHDVERSADPALAALLDELKHYPPPARPAAMPAADGSIAVPFKLAGPHGPLSFISTTTVFGTAVDVTLSELTVEAFFPADAQTAAAMERLVNAA